MSTAKKTELKKVTTHQLQEMKNRGEKMTKEGAFAKYYASEVAVKNSTEAVQIFGGYGFMAELAADGSHYRVEEIYRDCKIAEIYEGTNEIQKLVIARAIFGKEITG